INLYVVYNYDTDTWVNFKLFGMMGLTLVFVLVQGIFLMKYMDQAPPNSKD
ncbi:MAG: septation protein IspZ, partial [Gammaproteobacteria bacterium]|nr:septation protein IspZ [Gammaproteobacteria bacterium]